MAPVSSRRQLIENIVSLLSMRGVSYVLPLITLPYLVRVIGPENYGLIAFAQAFTQFFVILTDYGFNFTATREVANNREDISRVSEIFSTVLLVKMCLMVASILFVTSVAFTIPSFRENWPVYLIACMFIVGRAIFPVWFYQGMERMKYITAVDVISRVVGTVGIFAFVNSESDYLLAASLQSGSTLLAGTLGLSMVGWVAFVRPVPPALQRIGDTLRDGWPVFISQVTYVVKNEGGIFVLGLFYGDLIVGYYSIADRVIKAATRLTMPLSTAAYPRVNTLFIQSQEAAVAFLRKMLLFGGLVFLAVSLGLFLSADLVVWVATGEVNPAISILLRIMAFAPLISFLDNLYGFQVLLPLKRQKQFMKAAALSALSFLAGSFTLAPLFGAVGSATAFIASQAVSLVLYFILVHRTGIRLHRRMV